MHVRTDLPRQVRVLEHLYVPLADGTRLAARLWLPVDAEQDPVPAVLDAVPYRKGGAMAADDHARYAYIAGHGYACMRLDLRGSGESDGVLLDEYLAQEQDDNIEVIEWLAAQPWCTGAVGMIGMSWGGFAALQAAARAPAALRGAVAIHASEDRYADDVHYVGGCVSALDMLQWPTAMLSFLLQPPDPAIRADWREQWERRLEQTPAYIVAWLSHQRRDGYWASVSDDYASLGCPVFAVGGWSDGYRDAVFRLLEHAPVPVRGLVGPWGHLWPERGVPGPAIGFLAEVVRFFDCTLRGHENGFFDEPALTAWLQEPAPPAGRCAERPGRWVTERRWPPERSPLAVALAAGGVLAGALRGAAAVETLPAAGDGRREAAAASPSIRGMQACGLEGGVWCGDGGPADHPLDQRPDDGMSLCWDGPPLAERLELLGPGVAVLELASDRESALVCVRVCAVAPDGTSSLLARGLLNLTRREGRDRTVAMPPGEPVTVRVHLQSAGIAVPAGHRLRVAISPTYWPWAWPSPRPVALTVLGGHVELPARPARADEQPPRPFGPPEAAAPLADHRVAGAAPYRRVTRDLGCGETVVEFDWTGDRVDHLAAAGLLLGERNVTRLRIVEGDPLSAEVTCEAETSLARGDWRTRTAVRSMLTAGEQTFTATVEVDAYEGDRRMFARREVHEIPRDGA